MASRRVRWGRRRRRARRAVSRAQAAARAPLPATTHHRSRTVDRRAQPLAHPAAARGPACHRAQGKKGEAAAERWVSDRLGIRPAAWLVARTGVAAGEGRVAVRGGAMGDGGRRKKRPTRPAAGLPPSLLAPIYAAARRDRYAGRAFAAAPSRLRHRVCTAHHPCTAAAPRRLAIERVPP